MKKIQSGENAALSQAGKVSSLIEAGDWPTLTRLINEQAPALVAGGHHETLACWLDAIPAKLRDDQSWLCYWTGVCMVPRDITEARRWFERAFDMFEVDNEPGGLYLSWASIIDTLFLEYCDFSPMRRWTSIGEQLLDRHPLPPGEIEGRVTSAMFTALMHSEPAHPRIGEWARRLSDLLVHVPDDNARILMGASLVRYYTMWLGEHGHAEMVLEQFAGSRERREQLAPLAHIMLMLLECICHWNRCEIDEAHAAIREGLETAERTGVHQFDFLLCVQPVYICLGIGDLTGAERDLAKLNKLLPRPAAIEQAHWHYLAAWHDMECGELHVANERLEKCIQQVTKGSAPFQHVMHLIALAQVRHALGEREEIPSLLAESRAFAGSIGSPLIEFMVCCCEAYFAFEDGDEGAGLAALRESFVLGHRRGYVNYAWCRAEMLVSLCVKALEHGIEQDYARELVRIRGIVPESPPVHLADWPWPLKIFTLGRFSVVKDGTPVHFSTKAQHQPLALLKALIALGGREVPEEHLTEILWPDAEGDAAHSSFTTTLSRLRKLVGEATLCFRDGRLTLDAHYGWVDAWAFDTLLAWLNDNGPDNSKADHTLHKALHLYQGPFLASEGDIVWLLPLRERLRSRFLRAIDECARWQSEQDQWESVAALYQKGIEVEPLAESLYQGLIRTHLHLGQRTEALRAYERCHANLHVSLDISPSPATEALLKELRRED